MYENSNRISDTWTRSFILSISAVIFPKYTRTQTCFGLVLIKRANTNLMHLNRIIIENYRRKARSFALDKHTHTHTKKYRLPRVDLHSNLIMKLHFGVFMKTFDHVTCFRLKYQERSTCPLFGLKICYWKKLSLSYYIFLQNLHPAACNCRTF